jgi:hypothetical protein
VVGVQTGARAAQGGATASPVVVRLRREASTTPGRIRVFSLAVAGLFLLTGIATYGAVIRRTNGVKTVTASEPLILDAQALDTTLSQADATAANAFLGGGLEPADERALYQGDIDRAGRLLADAAARSGNAADVQIPLQTLAAHLPVYTGLVDTARANNRQGFPVGAAYLRQASRLMSGTLLPATQKLYAVDAGSLASGNGRARSVHDTALVLFLLGLLVVAMAGVQFWLYRQTNRILNLPLLGASVLAVVLLLVVVTQLRSEASEAAQGRDTSYASVNLLAQVRIAAFKAKADESLTLIGRGNGSAFDNDFSVQVATLPKLLDQARGVATPSEMATLGAATSALQAYLAVHSDIRRFDTGGQFDRAVALAVKGGTESAANAAFSAFDGRISSALDGTQQEFGAHLRASRGHLRGLTATIPIVLLLAGILALYGFQQRINEYR